jgi:ATP-binding cassette subfamily B protein
MAFVTSFSFRADPGRAAVGLVLTVSNSVGLPVFSFLLKVLVDSVLAHDRARVILAAVGFGVGYFLFIVTSLTSQRIQMRLQEKTGFLTGGAPSLEHHERADYLDEIELLRTQRFQLAQTFGSLVANLGTLAQLAGTVILLGRMHPLVALLPLFGLPSMWAATRAERIRQDSLTDSAERVRLARHLFEVGTTAGPAKEVRVFGLRAELADRHDRTWASVTAQQDAATRKGAALHMGGWSVFGIAYFGAVSLVLHEALAGRSSVGDVVLSLTLGRQINGQVQNVAFMATWLLENLKTARRFIWLEDHVAGSVAALSPAAPAEIPDRLNVGIDLVDVDFRYAGADHDVLSGVNLRIPAGATVAIVGDNGAGKTTLVKLLSRFYEPTSGEILVDGVPLRHMQPEAWRDRLAAGFQDFARFEFLARHVVGVGDVPRLDDVGAVTEALRRASAGEVAAMLPSGLDTQLGRSFANGVELSGGQWQKLALGRAMMRRAPLVLLLDEPTAALDAQTEHELFERFSGAARRVGDSSGAVTVLVSHRFSTVRMADLILVIDGGRLVESGTHHELMADRGLYAQLYALQARAYQ